MNRLAVTFYLLTSTLLWAAAPNASEWLQAVPGETPLTRLHLPGTHNSAALIEPLAGTARCQNLTIGQQLKEGVRFLDIRCRHQDDAFSLYHGIVSQEQTFAELQKTLASFLAKNPSEFVLVSIQETSKPSKNSRSFEETARAYFSQQKTLWNLESKLPTLAQVRGQALLLRRFSASDNLGIDATDWGHNDTHLNKQLLIQDQFQLSNKNQKWRLVTNLWQHSLKHPDCLSLNFSSGYLKNQIGLPNITAVSREVNPRLLNHLSTTPIPPGVLILDFASPELVSAIFRQNFAKH